LSAESVNNRALLRVFFENSPILRGSFDEVFVITADGQVELMHDSKGDRTPVRSMADRAYFQTAVRDQRPAVSDLVVSQDSGEPSVVLAHPVVRGGKTVGVLAGSLSLRQRDLASILAEGNAEMGETSLVVVTDANGHILAHPDTALIGTTLATEPRLRNAVARWRDSGKSLEPQGLHLDDAEALATAAAVPGADWMVWRWRPRTDVLAPLLAGRADAIRASAVLCAAMGVGLMLLLTWQLRALTQLRQRALYLFDNQQAAADGWPQASGEIGDLTRVLRNGAMERDKLEAMNSQILRQLQGVMAAAPVGIALTRNSWFVLVSKEMCRLLGRDEASLLNQAAQSIYASNEDYMAAGPRMEEAFSAGRPFDGELQFLRGDGTRFPGRLRGMPVEIHNRDAGTIWTLTDISDEVNERSSLEWAANHDTLTGLANRKAFDQRLAQLFEALPRSRPAALLVLDLDRFKPINDNHGHAAGDAMLRAVATAVQGCMRGGDLTVRLGGDEFAVLLERCPAEVALRVAEDVRASVEALRLPWQGHTLSAGASVGMAVLTEEINTADVWVASADRACYEAKAAGRNRVHTAGHLRLVAGG